MPEIRRVNSAYLFAYIDLGVNCGAGKGGADSVYISAYTGDLNHLFSTRQFIKT